MTYIGGLRRVMSAQNTAVLQLQTKPAARQESLLVSVRVREAKAGCCRTNHGPHLDADHEDHAVDGRHRARVKR